MAAMPPMSLDGEVLEEADAADDTHRAETQDAKSSPVSRLRGKSPVPRRLGDIPSPPQGASELELEARLPPPARMSRLSSLRQRSSAIKAAKGKGAAAPRQWAEAEVQPRTEDENRAYKLKMGVTVAWIGLFIILGSKLLGSTNEYFGVDDVGKMLFLLSDGVIMFRCWRGSISNKATSICFSCMWITGILCDWGVVGAGALWWQYHILILDVLLVVRADSKLCGGLICSCTLWLVAKSSNTAMQWGLSDLSQFDGSAPYPPSCECARPPCAEGWVNAGGILVGWLIVFYVDFFLTHRFSLQLHKENEKVRASIALAEDVAGCLVMYDTGRAADLLCEAGKKGGDDTVPAGLLRAYEGLLNNLSLYRPYLPHTLIPERHSPGMSGSTSRASQGDRLLPSGKVSSGLAASDVAISKPRSNTSPPCPPQNPADIPDTDIAESESERGSPTEGGRTECNSPTPPGPRKASSAHGKSPLGVNAPPRPTQGRPAQSPVLRPLRLGIRRADRILLAFRFSYAVFAGELVQCKSLRVWSSDLLEAVFHYVLQGNGRISRFDLECCLASFPGTSLLASAEAMIRAVKPDRSDPLPPPPTNAWANAALTRGTCFVGTIGTAARRAIVCCGAAADEALRAVSLAPPPTVQDLEDVPPCRVSLTVLCNLVLDGEAALRQLAAAGELSGAAGGWRDCAAGLQARVRESPDGMAGDVRPRAPVPPAAVASNPLRPPPASSGAPLSGVPLCVAPDRSPPVWGATSGVGAATPLQEPLAERGSPLRELQDMVLEAEVDTARENSQKAASAAEAASAAGPASPSAQSLPDEPAPRPRRGAGDAADRAESPADFGIDNARHILSTVVDAYSSALSLPRASRLHHSSGWTPTSPPTGAKPAAAELTVGGRKSSRRRKHGARSGSSGSSRSNVSPVPPPPSGAPPSGPPCVLLVGVAPNWVMELQKVLYRRGILPAGVRIEETDVAGLSRAPPDTVALVIDGDSVAELGGRVPSVPTGVVGWMPPDVAASDLIEIGGSGGDAEVHSAADFVAVHAAPAAAVRGSDGAAPSAA